MFICKTSEETPIARQLKMSLLFSRLVDNLPSATKLQNIETQETLYEHGYRLGVRAKDSDDVFLNNHLILRLHYHKESEYEYFIIESNIELFFLKEMDIALLVLK